MRGQDHGKCTNLKTIDKDEAQQIIEAKNQAERQPMLKVVATAAIGDGVESVTYDSSSQNAFCAAADGTVAIIHLDGPDKLTVLQTLKTKPGASVLGVDGKTHKIYIGFADFAGAGANPIPNSSKILVYSM